MKTPLAAPFTLPSPEEMQALVRRAHLERAQVMRQMLAALFRKPGRPEAVHDRHEHASLRPAA